MRKLIMLAGMIALISIPMRAEALVDQIVGDELCVDILSPIDIGGDGDEDEDQPICFPLIDLPI